jgi:hypothetical protein
MEATVGRRVGDFFLLGLRKLKKLSHPPVRIHAPTKRETASYPPTTALQHWEHLGVFSPLTPKPLSQALTEPPRAILAPVSNDLTTGEIP